MKKLKVHAALAAVALLLSAPCVGFAADAPPVQSEVRSLTARLMAALQNVSGKGLSGEGLVKAYQTGLESEIITSGFAPITVLAALEAVPASGGEQRAALEIVKARIKKATFAALRPTAFGGVLSGFPGEGASSSSSGGGSDYRRP